VPAKCLTTTNPVEINRPEHEEDFVHRQDTVNFGVRNPQIVRSPPFAVSNPCREKPGVVFSKFDIDTLTTDSARQVEKSAGSANPARASFVSWQQFCTFARRARFKPPQSGAISAQLVAVGAY
jgi:hypothetical protein